MVHLITELSKYTMLILFALYTYEGFSALKKNSPKKQKPKFFRQVVYLFLIHANGYAVLFASTKNKELLYFYLAQVVFLLVIISAYGLFYPKASPLVTNHMCMLLSLGFLMLTRLSYDSALRQFKLSVVFLAVCLLIPFLISRLGFFRNLTWVYAITGIVLLGCVAVLGVATKGANISFTIAGVTLQPSEFVKISFVF